jgi:Flp pilus assembly protein TadD
MLIAVRLPRMPRRSIIATLAAGVLVILLAPSAVYAQSSVVDLGGQTVDPLAPGDGVRATAFIFTTTDCPVANRYAPEIRRLFDIYSRQGIRFWLVYVNPRETPETIGAHTRTYALPMAVLRDRGHALVGRLGVSVTPEVAIVDPRGTVIYRGRIDDRYTELGVDRPVATRREFEEALGATVAGKAITTPTTRAVGCFISDFKPVTFARDVAPIVFDKCVSCHRAGGAAPFSLMTYADVRQRASQIVAVTERGYMPPWKAEADPAGFVGQKRLSDDDRAVLRQWAAQGAPEGDRGELPKAPAFADGWQLGTPDLIVTLPEPFTLAAGPTDAFRIFAIPLPIDGTKYVTGLEFQPGNARVVHHANIRLDRSAASRELDARDAAPGYDGLMARSAVYPEGHFLGWTPGQISPLVPPDMAWRLDPGTDLVVQLHMQPSGAPEQVRPVIGLFFGDRPATRTPTILRLGSQGIDIPPGEPRYTITDSYRLPSDVVLQAVQPHAHYRLKEVTGLATFPDGTERTLIHITDWDFRWQHVYRYERPIALPRGTRLSMRYIYDNSAGNPRNPQLPPERVHWGQRSFDEMGDLWFQFVSSDAVARNQLTAEIQQKMTGEDVIGYETMLRATPADAELHDDVAVLYLALGRARDAVKHFRASAALKPAEASAHFNLATALTMTGDLDEAVTAYREALKKRPGYPSALNNLGTVLSVQGRTDEALGYFRQAAAADPGNVQAQRNVAWHLAVRAASTAEEQREAVAAGERAAALTSQNDAQVLEALGAAYAAAGRFDRAVATVQRALTLTRDAALVATLREHLALYQQNRPYRTP